MAQLWIKDSDLIPVKDKIIVVTGGSSGMGLATTNLLLSLGAFVVSGDMNASPVTHPNHTFHKTDVTNWNDLKSLFKTAKDKHGRIDHVFANAGIAGKANYLEDKFDENGELQEPTTLTYDVNLRGMINTSYLGLHHMRHQTPPGGSIVCTASGSSFQQFAVWDYTTTKHGVLGFMRGAIPNLKNLPIRMNCIGPSWTITGMCTREICDAAGIEAQSADDVARDVVLLMADESRQGEFHYSVGGKYFEIEKSKLLPAAEESVGKGRENEQDVFEKLMAVLMKAEAEAKAKIGDVTKAVGEVKLNGDAKAGAEAA